MAVREFGNKMMEINARRIGEEKKKKKRGLEQQQQQQQQKKKKKTIKRSVSSSRVYVVTLAIFSRFVILALFVFWRILARPYDTSAGLTRPCLSPNQNGMPPLCLSLSLCLSEYSIFPVRGNNWISSIAFFPPTTLLVEPGFSLDSQAVITSPGILKLTMKPENSKP
jgi:hypothetical protein